MKKGIRKMLSAIACAALAMGCLAGCGSSTTGTTTEAATENASTAASEASGDGAVTDGKVYQIGICQLVQHDALDRATQGFEDALVKLLGEDHVQFNLQNAQGDSQT